MSRTKRKNNDELDDVYPVVLQRSRDAYLGEYNLRNTQKGLAAQLTVAADLVRHGWHPFLGLNWYGPSDLIAENDCGEIHRIEVKKAWDDRETRKPTVSVKPGQFTRRDVIAVVHNGTIYYNPPINILSMHSFEFEFEIEEREEKAKEASAEKKEVKPSIYGPAPMPARSCKLF